MSELREYVIEARPGFASGQRASDGLAQVRMNNVTTNGAWNWSRLIRIPVAASDVPEFLLQPGDVLFNNTNSTEQVGKSAAFSAFGEPITYSNHFTRIRTSAQLEPLYLALWLTSQWHRGVFARLCDRWVGQSAIRVDKLLSLRFAPPGVGEQRRIAAQLTDLLAAVDRAQRATRDRLDAIGALRAQATQSVFDAVMGARGVAVGQLGDLTDGDWILNADYASEGVRLLQVGDVGSGSLTLRSNRFISTERAGQLNCTMLRPGDVLISRMADPIGRACLLPDLGYPTITAVDVTVFRPRDALVDREFVTLFMNSPRWLGVVAAKASGATRARISRRNLELLVMPVPPLENQRRVVAALRERLATIDSMTKSIAAEFEAIEALPAALLREAFGSAQ